MSDVIRDAIIRIRYETQKSKLEGPELSQTVKAHEQVAQAAKKVSQAHKESGDAAKHAAEAHEDFGRRSFQSMAHAGHGVLQLARGIALMSASGEEDTRKLLEGLIKIEAAVSIARGAANLARFAGALGPIGVAVAGVSAVVAVGAGVWEHYAAAEREAVKAGNEAREVLSKLAKETQKNREQENATAQAGRNRAGDELIASASTIEEKQRRIKSQIKQAETEARIAARQEAEIEHGLYRAPGSNFGEQTPEMAELRRKYGSDESIRAHQAGLLRFGKSATQRKLELLGIGHSGEVEQIRSREESTITQLHETEANESIRKKVRRETSDFQMELKRNQFKDLIGGLPIGFGIGGALGGAAMNVAQNATPQQKREAGTHWQAQHDIEKANQAYDEGVRTLVRKILQLDKELERISGANPN